MNEMRFRLLGLWALVIGMFLSATSLSWAQGQSNAIVVKDTKHALAPPLSQIGPIPPQSGQLSSLADEDYDDNGTPGYWRRTTSPVQDSVLQGSPDTTSLTALSTLSTNSGLNILGIGTGFNGYTTQANRPDTNGAVGPTQFVQWVNYSFAVFNKSDGSVAYGPALGNTLWQALGGHCAANPQLDGIAQFDKLANRWVMMMPVFNAPDALCVAVSTTSDATNGGWNLYDFLTPGSPLCGCRLMPDYPKLGIWPDGYYVTYNGGLNLNFVGAAACVLDRNSMLKDAAATMQCFTLPTSYGAVLPADLDGTTPPPAASPEYFLNFDGNNQSLDLWQFHVDWTTPANSTFTGPTNIPVAPFNEACGETVVKLNYTTGACIPQAGTTQTLDSYGDRVMYRLAYRNFADHQSLLVNHTVNTGTSSNNTGIRWYELQNAQGTFGLYQQGTYAPDSSYRWMGSIAMDKLGDIGLGYSVSSSTLSPSIRYTGRAPSDPLGQMESEVDVLSSQSVPHGSQTYGIPWGDYSSMAIDSTDDCTFWYTTEYLPTTGSHWSTRITSFSFPSCINTTQNYTLSVNEVGQGTVTSTDGKINCANGSGTCSAVYASGSSVTMNATAAGGWTFSGWSGSCSGGNPCNVVMSSNLSPTATFATTTPWAIVHKASSAGSPITNLTIPATGTGHLIAVAMMFNGGTSVSSVSDNATGGSNTYVSAGARATIGKQSTEIWYAVNSKSGATVVTPTFAGSPTHVEITVWEVSGISALLPDVTNITSGTVTLNNTPGPAVTTTQVGDFILSVLFAINSNFTAITSGNEFTNDFRTYGNGWAHITSTSATAGTHQASWYTPSPTGAYCASTVAFRVQ